VYSVTLQVEDDDGDTGVAVHQITINNNAPVAVIVVDQQYIEPGDTVTFDGTGSSDPNGDNLTYEWKLGDTVIGTEAVITYTFSSSGNFEVILTVTDDDPNNPMSSSVTVMIYVNAPPIADFTYDPEDPYFGEVVTFDGSISFDPDGTIVNYSWDFDDGTDGYGMIVYHIFIYNGWFTVTLTVTDDMGSTDSHSEDIYVQSWLKTSKKIRISNAPSITTRATHHFEKNGESLNYPPKTPSDPYPEDGTTNVPIDVVLSWTGGEDNPPDPPTINGSTSGKVGVEYQYDFSLSDPDDDLMYLRVDWGNGTPGPWQGPYDSDTIVRLNHTWNEKGTYTIRAQAKDIYDVESEWSTLTVTMPKNKMASSSVLLRLLERLSQSFHFFSFIFDF